MRDGALLRRAGSWAAVTPTSAGWRYLSFAVVRIGGGESVEWSTGSEEVCIVVLAGSASVESDLGAWELAGRSGVFSGMPWALYLPPGSRYRVSASGDLELAVTAAIAEKDHPPRLIRPEDVEVEVRGAGNATRQINHIIGPAFPAHRLNVVEVYTPSGNWSSYPPHKHDEDRGEAEAVLEETYYFRTSRPEGFGIQRLYSPSRGLDLTTWVGDGDLLEVPYGYHASAAAHGFDLYYLNALAGDRRSLAASDDPSMAWIRESWRGVDPDPRVPMVRPE